MFPARYLQFNSLQRQEPDQPSVQLPPLALPGTDGEDLLECDPEAVVLTILIRRLETWVILLQSSEVEAEHSLLDQQVVLKSVFHLFAI